MTRFTRWNSAGIVMALRKTLVLAIAVLGVAAIQPLLAPLSSANGDSPIFIPEVGQKDQQGDHYDTVMANYIRRCNSLSSQFNRARADMGDSALVREATALYEQGVEHCSSGARLQGIDELSEAIRKIGAIPRVEL
jgi:hypothetical protein